MHEMTFRHVPSKFVIKAFEKILVKMFRIYQGLRVLYHQSAMGPLMQKATAIHFKRRSQSGSYHADVSLFFFHLPYSINIYVI